MKLKMDSEPKNIGKEGNKQGETSETVSCNKHPFI